MEDNRLIIANENIFQKIIKKIKKIFKKNKYNDVNSTYMNGSIKKEDNETLKNNFLNRIKAEEDNSLIYLKLKLENNEIKAIDLTDEQIDALQKIYDDEIKQKREKLLIYRKNVS